MTDRPTPEQIADEFGSEAINLLARLDHHGYVIVHPDNVPDDCGSIDPEFRSGWKGCRNHIFGGNDD